MKSKRYRRMVGIRKGGVAVITVQYKDGEVMQYIWGWTCIVSAAGLLFAAMVLAGWV